MLSLSAIMLLIFFTKQVCLPVLPLQLARLLSSVFLHYVQAIVSFGLHIFYGDSLSFRGFTDADWVDDVDNQKSMSEYLVFLGSAPIS